MSFIETSALDSTNVETAFQNILTGSFNSIALIHTILNMLFRHCHSYGKIRSCNFWGGEKLKTGGFALQNNLATVTPPSELIVATYNIICVAEIYFKIKGTKADSEESAM